ncbi:MAG: thiamine pyrophosphate-binding protein [Bacillota bacterium]
MTEAYGGQLVAKVMKEEGIKHIFGVHGGHIWPLLTPINEEGIMTIHMRHEQSGVFAADAYSKASGEIGVCFGTAGPGVQNMAVSSRCLWVPPTTGT